MNGIRCNICGHTWEGQWSSRSRCPKCNSNLSFSIRESLEAVKVLK